MEIVLASLKTTPDKNGSLSSEDIDVVKVTSEVVQIAAQGDGGLQRHLMLYIDYFCKPRLFDLREELI